VIAEEMAPYNKDTYKTINGTVAGSVVQYNPNMKEDGLHLNVTTSSVNFLIHVCPKWYADKENISFSNGGTVTVSGSEFTKDGEKNIYAATIVRANIPALHLRDPDTGKELWTGREQTTTPGSGGKAKQQPAGGREQTATPGSGEKAKQQLAGGR